jgi:hypothetical protein
MPESRYVGAMCKPWKPSNRLSQALTVGQKSLKQDKNKNESILDQ